MGVLVWAAALFAAFQPGLMSSDSIDQYTQGLNGHYNDVHPPLGSWILGISGKLVGSPWLVLAMQLLVMGACMAALVKSSDATKGRWGLLIMGAFLLTPTVWALAVILWKDVMTATVLLGAVAALKYRRPAIALVLLLAGVAFRHNALIAAVPLAIPAVVQLSPQTWRRPQQCLAFVIVVVGLTFSPALVSRTLNSNRAWAAGQLFLFDLSGIYAAHPELVPQSFLSGDTSPDEIVRAYSPLHVGHLFAGHGGTRPIMFGSLEPRRKEFIDEWSRMVRKYPTTWMRHRLDSFAGLVGASPGPVFYPFHHSIDPNPFQLRVASEGWMYKRLHDIKLRAANSLFFRGWSWLLVLCGLTVVALRSVRQKPIAFCTALSGLGYTLSYLIIGIGSDFRFIYWSIIATFATLALLVTEAKPLPHDLQPPPDTPA
ncbi:hypothetical protein QEG98_24940 [Myxococcus sp. MxC21-1]|uniref:hypothetical protein n=1 Tax=Myxococcus sp. MxC21-1 TaxID=3041439 RepID=UPI002930FDE8|nr:hypothetical protein [Myxococcus sp. MxC21-1]WNZ59324.1 hypothetical protein QEG98_24940 [Myxococcus sp. MxC21-1]